MPRPRKPFPALKILPRLADDGLLAAPSAAPPLLFRLLCAGGGDRPNAAAIGGAATRLPRRLSIRPVSPGGSPPPRSFRHCSRAMLTCRRRTGAPSCNHKGASGPAQRPGPCSWELAMKNAFAAAVSPRRRAPPAPEPSPTLHCKRLGRPAARRSAAPRSRPYLRHAEHAGLCSAARRGLRTSPAHAPMPADAQPLHDTRPAARDRASSLSRLIETNRSQP